jgi:hypothetical protein
MVLFVAGVSMSVILPLFVVSVKRVVCDCGRLVDKSDSRCLALRELRLDLRIVRCVHLVKVVRSLEERIGNLAQSRATRALQRSRSATSPWATVMRSIVNRDDRNRVLAVLRSVGVDLDFSTTAGVDVDLLEAAGGGNLLVRLLVAHVCHSTFRFGRCQARGIRVWTTCG